MAGGTDIWSSSFDSIGTDEAAAGFYWSFAYLLSPSSLAYLASSFALISSWNYFTSLKNFFTSSLLSVLSKVFFYFFANSEFFTIWSNFSFKSFSKFFCLLFYSIYLRIITKSSTIISEQELVWSSFMHLKISVSQISLSLFLSRI